MSREDKISAAKMATVQYGILLMFLALALRLWNLQVVSGHPMLTQAAIQAVKQWKYKPYYLNGQPVEVDTNVTVNFSLAG